jgi:hypothetical protein
VEYSLRYGAILQKADPTFSDFRNSSFNTTFSEYKGSMSPNIAEKLCFGMISLSRTGLTKPFIYQTNLKDSD